MWLLQGSGQWVARECYKNYQNHFRVNVSGYLINVGLNPKQARGSGDEKLPMKYSMLVVEKEEEEEEANKEGIHV
jgi:hypothetical protein